MDRIIDLVKSYLLQMEAIFKALSLPKKITLLVLLSLVGALLILTTLYIHRPDYQLLYSHLTPEDAAAIVEKLKQEKLPYKLTADGTSILVASEKKYDVRLQLATEGLPRGGAKGFEIFDRTNWGMTSFMERLNFQRALQGELARTINNLAEIEDTRVHIVLPEKAIFKEDQKKATASVVVKIAPGRDIGQGQVQGIIHLIASSVEGLEPQEVTVLDNRGRILSGDNNTNPETQLTNSQLGVKQKLEKDMEQRIQSMLEQVLGRNKAIVRVSTDLDFHQVESTEESYDPDRVVVRSEQRTEEKSLGGEVIAKGVPGAGTEIPSATTPGAASSMGEGAQKTTSQSQRQKETIDYEISKVTRRIMGPYGEIKKLSVAVMVDGSYKKKGDGTYEYIPRPTGEITKLENLVKGAMGFDDRRGDQLQLVNIPFDNSGLETETYTMGKGHWQDWLIALLPVLKKSLSLLIPLLLFSLFILKPLLNWLSQAGQGLSLPTGLPKKLRELEIEAGIAEREIPGLNTQQKVLEIAKSNPGRTAQLAKEWLREGD